MKKNITRFDYWDQKVLDRVSFLYYYYAEFDLT